MNIAPDRKTNRTFVLTEKVIETIDLINKNEKTKKNSRSSFARKALRMFVEKINKSDEKEYLDFFKYTDQYYYFDSGKAHLNVVIDDKDYKNVEEIILNLNCPIDDRSDFFIFALISYCKEKGYFKEKKFD